MLAKVISEFVGTFLLVFLGCSAAALMGGKDNAAMAVALAFGVALVIIICNLGSISAHANPAVSLGMAINGQLTYPMMCVYWIVQVIAAICAAGLIVYLLGKESGVGASIGSLTNTYPWKAVIVEAILTFVFVYTILVVTNNTRYKQYGGIIIGLALLVGVLVGYYMTGGSLNPARSIGPAIFSGNLKTVWIYIVGPLVGGLLAAVLYRYINDNTNAYTHNHISAF